MVELSKILGGGDLRSIGRANYIAQMAEDNPELVNYLFRAVLASGPVIRMRCADALEKLSRTQPEKLNSFRKPIIQLLEQQPPKEVLWRLLQISGRLRWTPNQASKLFAICHSCLRHSSSIVKVSAMQTLYDLLALYPHKKTSVVRVISRQFRNGTPAIRARAKKLLTKLAV